jgi:cysteine desulfurase
MGIPLLCDAVQAVGKIPVDVRSLGVDYLSIAGHKFHGPLGVAALWVDPAAELSPLLVGGGQEAGRRASTENIPGIVGLGRACELAKVELAERGAGLLGLRRRLEAGAAELPGVTINAFAAPRLPNTVSLTAAGVLGEALAGELDERGFAVSTGAACHSGRPSPSATIVALGHDPVAALGTIRISVGAGNSVAEVDLFLAALSAALGALRR